MDTNYFQHPRRFPKNAEGPFYTTGHRSIGRSKDVEGEWCADCLWCEAPEYEAPELLAELNDENLNTYFVRQPKTPAEVAAACRAACVCCVAALRYGGQDRDIIKQLNNDPSMCDYVVIDGALRLTVDKRGELLPFAQKMCKWGPVRVPPEVHVTQKKWWQFWW